MSRRVCVDSSRLFYHTVTHIGFYAIHQAEALKDLILLTSGRRNDTLVFISWLVFG